MADYEEWNGIDEMKSMCMSCGEEGLTKIMLHKIPHFRELVISSFNCPHCYERNNDVQFGGEIQLQGCKYELKVKIIIFKILFITLLFINSKRSQQVEILIDN